ncbi:uncharacterized protein LOC120154125 [Hibiscus syriacus]|uniref:uncharacterized protein LOC120154125 n=1 Tax=Hibiscus syriacus TaxID=106335 RepID=UPI001923E44A|nr:uncharacterized protein LOC120154125 [Hibiscus syriacus]
MDWRKLFGCSEGLDLEYHPPRVSDGSISVHPPPEVLDAGIDEWKLSIVGQCLGAAPNLSSMQRIVNNLWKMALGGSKTQVSFAGNNHYIFSFDSETIRDWVLESRPWHILNKPLILRKWEPNWKRLHFDLSRCVNLFNVPLELFSKTGLSYIASAIRSPLTMDSVIAAKTHLEFAKVCIEIGVNDVIPKSIDVVLKDVVSVSVDSVPKPTVTLAEGSVDSPKFHDVPNTVPYVSKELTTNKSTAGSSEILSYSQIPNLIRGRGIPSKNKSTSSESNNIFDILSTVENPSKFPESQPRKIRSASLGVANLINELKLKKKDKLTKVTKVELEGSRKGIDFTLCHASKQCLTIKGLHSGSPFILTVVYSSNDGRERRLMWQQLRDLDRILGHFPWIIGGDFNIILNSYESSDFDLLGPSPSDMRDFQDVLSDLDLFYHPFTGPTFTWSNKQQIYFLARKLVRVFINHNWISSFRSSHVEFLAPGISDHCLALLWTHKEILFSKLKRLKPLLKALNNSFFSDLSSRVNLKRFLEDAEAMFLKQKSKVQWLKKGDNCSKFFHSSVALKNKRDTIRLLIDDYGNRLESFDDMSSEVINYFSNILGSTDPMVKCIDHNVLKDLLHSSLPADLAANLSKDVTKNEIKDGFFSQGNDKAPGPDGYSPLFFKKSWAIIGDDTTAAILQFFQESFILLAFNATTIALIPKIPNPSTVKDFRPISCCSVVYKAITKILANKLSILIPHLITLNHTAFVKGRSIVDNTLLAQEIAMNLPPNFTSWIETCYLTASFSVSLNGSLTGYFRGARGVRQGDPLSPYLFVLSMNILSKLLNLGASKGLFSYHPKCKRIGLTHLSFADDLLIFCKGSVDSIIGVTSVLDTFYEISGLKLNASKCELFTTGVSNSTLNDLKMITGFNLGGARVSWQKICLPKSEGGLGLKDLKTWNKACMMSLIKNILAGEVKPYMSWSLKQILMLRTEASSILPSISKKIGHIWNDIRVKNPKVHWQSILWFSLLIPKHSIISWMTFLDRLPTKERLHRMGIVTDCQCTFCGNGMESRNHLFFESKIATALWFAIFSYCGLRFTHHSWDALYAWATVKWKGSSILSLIMKLSSNALIYTI